MQIFSSFYDTYSLRARLYPLLIGLIPLLILIIYFGLTESIMLTGFSSAFFLPYSIFITTQIRGMGKKVQKRMFKNKQDFPSVKMLRSNIEFNNQQLKRIENNYKLEFGEPSAKKSKFFWINVSEDLRKSRRDRKKYPLVFLENCNYGFRRNLLGIKVPIISFSAIVLSAISTHTIIMREFDIVSILLIAFSLLYIGIITLRVNEEYVQEAADDYAKRLIETLL